MGNAISRSMELDERYDLLHKAWGTAQHVLYRARRSGAPVDPASSDAAAGASAASTVADSAADSAHSAARPAPGTPRDEDDEEKQDAFDWDLMKDTLGKGLLAFLFFEGMNHIVPALAARFFPGWDSLNDEQKRRAVPYFSSSIHHLAVVPFSFWAIWRELRAAPHEILDYRLHRKVLAWSTGYFLADFWYARQDWMREIEYAIHHIIAILVTTRISGVRGVTRWIPYFLMCETTSLLLAAMWFLRQFKLTHTPAYNSIALLFAALFFVLRVVALPRVILGIFTDHPRMVKRIGVIAHTLWPVIGLQWWWFFKIAKQVLPLLRGAASGAAGAAEAAAEAAATATPTN